MPNGLKVEQFLFDIATSAAQSSHDLNDRNHEGRPLKKKATLNFLLSELAAQVIEFHRVEIKTIDIRKYALGTIISVDMCLDKFAWISSACQKVKSNEQENAGLIEALVDRLVGWPQYVFLVTNNADKYSYFRSPRAIGLA